MTVSLPKAKHGELLLYYDASLGSDIKEVLEDAWLISLRTDIPVRLIFNDKEFTITKWLTPTDALAIYWAKKPTTTSPEVQ